MKFQNETENIYYRNDSVKYIMIYIKGFVK